MTARSVDLGDSVLAYSDIGSGHPVVWLHGSGPGATGLSNFGGNLAAFEGFRHIVVDLPGWGGSTRAAGDRPLTFDAADRVIELLARLNIDRAHFVGNSYGGGVSMRIAATKPSLVERLVLMAPGGVLPADVPPFPVGLGLLLEYMVSDEPSRDEMANFVRHMVWDEALATEELITERYESSLHRHPELPIPPNYGDVTPDLVAIEAPTLLVWGREDQTVPLTWAPTILHGIRNAELRVLPNCRHWVQYERAQDFNRIVNEFLATATVADNEGE